MSKARKPFAVTAIIFSDEGSILSVSRKENHEDFNLPGGKIDKGETPLEALVRELEEETGLVLDGEFKKCFVRPDRDNYVCLTFSYETTIPEDSVTVGLREGEAVVAWKTWEDITTDNTYAVYNQSLKAHLER
jgi:8-oxo-dGTP pyrophosphatase MutT (NUDIX family)